MYSIMLQAEDGLTLRGLISDIPHDAGAIVVYVMLLGFGWLIWRANRKNRPNP